MEIKNTLGQLDPYRARLEKTEKEQNAARASKDTKGASSQGDRVSLSPEAKLRTETYTAAMNAPEVRQQKVDAIKAQVDTGTYQVDSKKVAEKLLQEEPGLFGA